MRTLYSGTDVPMVMMHGNLSNTRAIYWTISWARARLSLYPILRISLFFLFRMWIETPDGRWWWWWWYRPTTIGSQTNNYIVAMYAICVLYVYTLYRRWLSTAIAAAMESNRTKVRSEEWWKPRTRGNWKILWLRFAVSISSLKPNGRFHFTTSL